MDRNRTVRSTLIAAMVITSIALVPSCRRAPEETAPAVSPETQVEAPKFDFPTLELPQTNSEIGITVSAAPKGLVATYNDTHWLKMTDEFRPSLNYIFVPSGQYLTGVASSSIEEFEAGVLNQSDGELIGKGDLETSLGVARWASGIFSEDGEMTDQLILIAPHPNREGRIIVSAICPPNLASAEERLNVIKELLAHIS